MKDIFSKNVVLFTISSVNSHNPKRMRQMNLPTDRQNESNKHLRYLKSEK